MRSQAVDVSFILVSGCHCPSYFPAFCVNGFNLMSPDPNPFPGPFAECSTCHDMSGGRPVQPRTSVQTARSNTSIPNADVSARAWVYDRGARAYTMHLILLLRGDLSRAAFCGVPQSVPQAVHKAARRRCGSEPSGKQHGTPNSM